MELKTCNDCGNFIWNDGFTPMPNVCVECRFEDGSDGPSNWMPKEVLTMPEYIKREYAVDAVLDVYYDTPDIDLSGEKFKAAILKIQAADVAPVRHGRWELTTHSFYRDTFDESCELCVYIVANCSECSGNHPNSYQVFSKTLYAPDDADDDFRFDQKAEEEKALLEFRNKKYEFAYYCPNCGAKMDLED